MIAVLLGFLILFGLQFPHPRLLDTLWLVDQIRSLGDPVLTRVAGWFRWEWPSAGISLLPVGAAFVVWVVKRGADGLIYWAQMKLLPASVQAPAAGKQQSSMGISVKSLLMASSLTESARQKLLRRKKRIEEALKAVKRRRCSFLSMDVVGSTKMKVGQDPRLVTATFLAYEEMLKAILEECAAWKQAWTPDGVLVCFQQVEDGVRAAQRVLEDLKEFNASRNKLRTPFRVRCGLSEGEVAIFEDSKLEKVTDPTIDLAGQLQKYARANTLWISAQVYDSLAAKSGFQPIEQEVGGHRVFEWLPGAPAAAAHATGMPSADA
jgi:class 3 adenylate cyclase